MPNILLTRIDNRLIHGQVGVTWVRSLGANLIDVANDDVAKDPLQQKLMSITADNSGAGTRFFSLEKTIEIIHKASASQKIFLASTNCCRNIRIICSIRKHSRGTNFLPSLLRNVPRKNPIHTLRLQRWLQRS